MKKKYELTDETIKYRGRTLHRIRALKDFNTTVEGCMPFVGEGWRSKTIKKGDLGGFVESERNLSQEGYCWVHDDAKVFDDALVVGNAQIFGNIFDNAIVFGSVVVRSGAEVCDNAIVFGSAVVCSGAEVCDNAIVFGSASVFGKIFDNAIVHGNVVIFGEYDKKYKGK